MLSLRPPSVKAIARHLAVASMVALATMISACSSESPVAPAAPSIEASNAVVHGGLSSATAVNGLRWKGHVTGATASMVIGPNGGTLTLENGVSLIVPKGAVSSDLTFSIRRLPGVIVAYDFQPHGTRFAVPVTIVQPTADINLARFGRQSVVRGAYFPDASQLDQVLGRGIVTEFRPTTVSTDRSFIRFSVEHFSGYMISMD